MGFYERQREKSKQDIIDFLQAGDLFYDQIRVLLNKGESYTRKVLAGMVLDNQVCIKKVWMGKNFSYLYTIDKQKTENNYNKLLTTKW